MVKMLQIFTDISDEHPVPVLRQYVILQYSPNGSSKLHRKVCIYLQINIFLYNRKSGFTLTVLRKP